MMSNTTKQQLASAANAISNLQQQPQASNMSTMSAQNALATMQQAANALNMQQQQQQQQQATTANPLNTLSQPSSAMATLQQAANIMSGMQSANTALTTMQQPANSGMSTVYPQSGTSSMMSTVYPQSGTSSMMNRVYPPNMSASLPKPSAMTTLQQIPNALTTTNLRGPNAVTNMQHLIKGDRNMYMSTDDTLMMRQINDTHTPDGRSFTVKPLLHIVEDILALTGMNTTTLDSAITPGTTHSDRTEEKTYRFNHMEGVDDKAYQANVTSILEAVSHIIDRLSCELQIRCLSGAEGHVTTVSILQMLSNYPWDAKLVLTLAAFAYSYGEFWLLAQLFSSNQLARSMAMLKQVPLIMEHSGSLKHRFDALSNLLSAVMDLAKAIISFEELPAIYITKDVPALATTMATIPTAVYWSIRSIIACATQISCLTSMGHEYTISMTELSWELATLLQRIKQIHEHLKKHLDICYQHIDEKLKLEAYESLRHLFDITHIDNMKVLKALIYPRDDILPLVEGSSKRRVSLDVLRRKNVLLLISGVDISQDELSILEQIYSESRDQSRMLGTRIDSLYELVWMPIVDLTHVGQYGSRFTELTYPSQKRNVTFQDDSLRSTTSSTAPPLLPAKYVSDAQHAVFSQYWTDAMQKRFDEIRSTMPWYSVYHPSIIDQSVVRFVKERWHLRNKPILVVLDPQGKELSPNALHMMWIWGTTAFPFTSMREESLWREETWRLELLVSGMDPTIYNNWIRDGKFIILYGGEDIEWIRRFTTTARQVALAAGLPLEMAYVGKSTKREMVRKAMATINVEKLSYCWQDPTMIWFFWARLESMLFSKIQVKKIDDHQDPLMQEIKKLLSYDKSGGWALLAKGSYIITSGHAQTVLSTFQDYDAWKEEVPHKGFDNAFKEYHGRLHVANLPCCRFEFLTTVGRIPDQMSCPECFRHMDKYSTFLCCHDEHTGVPSFFN